MKPTLFSLLLFFGLFLGFAACSNEDDVDPSEQATADDTLIREYLAKDTISNAVKTPSGLYYAVRTAGTGQQVQKNHIAKVHYIGRFLNGQKFDSSYDRGEPIEFKVGAGQVIKGWDEGLQLMKVGETALLYIPSALAYGPYGTSGIPSNTVLKFEVTVLEVR